MSKPIRVCTVCDDGMLVPVNRGMCRRHEHAWRTYGDPLAGRVPLREQQAFYLTNVDRETDECIIWPYSLHDFGYGQVYFDGKKEKVHRLSYLRHHGPPPTGKPEAGHRPIICHTPACFNGCHLRWISRKQQALDRKADGTFISGAEHINAKLTWDQVNTIRQLYNQGGVTQAKLALTYEISQSKIWKIVTFQSYIPR